MQHEIDFLTRVCIGCGVPARDLVPGPLHCPAQYVRLWGKVEGGQIPLKIIITPDEQLIIRQEGRGEIIRFDQRAMFEIRDHIDEGVGRIRDARGKADVRKAD